MINNDELINKVRSYNKFLNQTTLRKAYDFALNAHKNQKRMSGDPYVIHPVAVADILSDLKLDSATEAALPGDVSCKYDKKPVIEIGDKLEITQ